MLVSLEGIKMLPPPKKRCPCPNPWNLTMCYFTQQSGIKGAGGSKVTNQLNLRWGVEAGFLVFLDGLNVINHQGPMSQREKQRQRECQSDATWGRLNAVAGLEYGRGP